MEVGSEMMVWKIITCENDIFFNIQSPPVSSTSFSRIPGLSLMHQELNNILATV